MLHLLAWGNILILLCYWVPYGTRCHHMPNIESYFLKFSQPKGHWKICTFKALNFGPRSSTSDLIYHPCNFWNFFSLYCFGRGDILQQSMLWELQFKLQFSGLPNIYVEKEKFCFSFFSFDTSLSFQLPPPPYLNCSKVFWCSLFTVFVYDLNWFFALL